MANKSAGERVSGGISNAIAIRSIVAAFMRGGWNAAALQALKHYWPQILAIVVSLFMLTLILFCSVPLLLFTDQEEDNSVAALYVNYDTYCEQMVERIRLDATREAIYAPQNTKTPGTTDQPATGSAVMYAVETVGEKMQKANFIALHAVSVGNDPAAITEASIQQFVNRCIAYSITDGENPTIIIRYLTPNEVMDKLEFSDADRSWVQMMTETLQNGGV